MVLKKVDHSLICIMSKFCKLPDPRACNFSKAYFLKYVIQQGGKMNYLKPNSHNYEEQN